MSRSAVGKVEVGGSNGSTANAASLSRSWLMKAEPDTRLERGIDVAFGIDKFQSVKTTAWDGVRNHVAKNHMRSMAAGDKVLFYHSNTAIPGIAGLAKVSKEAFPDSSAWDPNHPYFDPKTKEDSPTWYCVEVAYVSRLSYLVPLELLKMIKAGLSDEQRQDLAYLSDQHTDAIKNMALLSAARLSVQPVSAAAYQAVELLGIRGVWTEWEGTKWNKSSKRKVAAKQDSKDADSSTKSPVSKPERLSKPNSSTKGKRKAKEDDSEHPAPRRSTRAKR